MNEKKLTPIQLQKLGKVYDGIAKLMPLDGRDYTVRVDFGDDDTVGIQFVDITPLGRYFKDHCMKNLADILRNNHGTERPKTNTGMHERRRNISIGRSTASGKGTSELAEQHVI